jgi:tetratricopeptide (TPR) repeat protein
MLSHVWAAGSAAVLVAILLLGPVPLLAEGDGSEPGSTPIPDAIPETPYPTPELEPNPETASAPEAEYQIAYSKYRKAVAEKDLQKALIYARKSHELAVRDLGPRNARTGVLAYNLGAVSFRLERYVDALGPLREAEATYLENYGADSSKNLLPVRKLADAYGALRVWPQAERYSIRAMEIVETNQGRTAPEITEILMELTQITQSMGHAKRMRSYANRALYNLHQDEDTKTMAIGHAYISLATAELMLGDASASHKSLDRALEIYEIHLSPDDPKLLDLYAFAAEAFERTGRATKARKYRRKLEDAES